MAEIPWGAERCILSRLRSFQGRSVPPWCSTGRSAGRANPAAALGCWKQQRCNEALGYRCTAPWGGSLRHGKCTKAACRGMKWGKSCWRAHLWGRTPSCLRSPLGPLFCSKQVLPPGWYGDAQITRLCCMHRKPLRVLPTWESSSIVISINGQRS